MAIENFSFTQKGMEGGGGGGMIFFKNDITCAPLFKVTKMF